MTRLNKFEVKYGGTPHTTIIPAGRWSEPCNIFQDDGTILDLFHKARQDFLNELERIEKLIDTALEKK